jgi:hypothetical protein
MLKASLVGVVERDYVRSLRHTAIKGSRERPGALATASLVLFATALAS